MGKGFAGVLAAAVSMHEQARRRLADGYTRGKHNKVRTELLEILQHNPTAWQLSGTRAVFIMEPMTLRKLRKDIPDYLLSSSRRTEVL